MASRYKMTGSIDRNGEVDIIHMPVAMPCDKPVLFVLNLESDICGYDLMFMDEYSSLLKSSGDMLAVDVLVHDFRFEWFKAMDKVIKLIPKPDTTMVKDWNRFTDIVGTLAHISRLNHGVTITLLGDLSACSDIKELIHVWVKAHGASEELNSATDPFVGIVPFSSLFLMSIFGLSDQIDELKTHHGLQDSYYLHYDNKFKTPVILGFVPRKGA